MNRLLALGLMILGLALCVVVYWGIADGEIGLKGGGEATRVHEPISFWLVTAFRALIPAVMFFFAIALLRKK